MTTSSKKCPHGADRFFLRITYPFLDDAGEKALQTALGLAICGNQEVTNLMAHCEGLVLPDAVKMVLRVFTRVRP